MAEILNRIAGGWFEWQWAMLWQTAVLIGLVAVIDRLIRKRAWPQLRYTLWLLVFVKLVLPPGLASPVSVTSQVPALAHKAAQAGTQMPVAPVETHATASLPAEPAPSVAAESQKYTESAAVALPQAPPVAARSGQTISEPLSWTVYAMSVWLIGVVSLGLGLYIRLRRLARDHSASHPTDVPEWFADLLRQTAGELGLKRAPRVVFSDKVCCPAVFGVLRPILLFPADRLPTTRQETRHILLHELAHIKRGDLLVHAGYMVLATAYWINPLLWLIRKHVQNLRELCCDATVAAHLREETAGYRETLLATGRALLAQPVDPGLGLLGLFENSGWLPIRLQWLQKNTWRRPWLRRTSVAAVAILMLCCILPMASINAAGATASDPEFRVALPNGITIELVGIRKAQTNQWWRPDGTPLAEAPYDSSEGDPQHQNPYEFVVHFENLPEGVTGGLRIDPAGGGWGGAIPETMDKLKPHKAGKPVENMAYIVTDQDPKTETVTVRVDLATGEWVTEQPEMLVRSSGGWATSKYFSSTLDAVVGCAVPREEAGQVYVPLFYALGNPREQKYDARLIAVETHGAEHKPEGGGGGGGSYFHYSTNTALASHEDKFDMRLKDIHRFNLQTRSHTWIEFKNISLRPGEDHKVEIVTTTPAGSTAIEKQSRTSEASVRALDEKSANQEFKVTLPTGGTIELIGVRKTGTDQWWRPDGGPLPESPYDFSEETYRSDLYEFALRYENLPEGSSGGIDIERHLCGGAIPMWYRQVQKAGKPVEGVTYVIAGPEPGTETTMLAVYLATGSWATDHFYPRMSDGWHDDVSSSSTLGAVAFAMPYDKDGKTYATVFHTASDPHKQDVRLTAVDVANVEHPPAFQNGGWSAAGLATTSSEFDLPLEDAAGFNLQRRPYTRIEFKNVSLRPGKHQKVEIVTIPASQPAIAEAKEEAQVPEGFSSFRDFSSQTLQAFHLAYADYLREHPDSDLPKRPWSLKFRLPKQVFFDGHYQDVRMAPIGYVTQTGYFRPGGFPSLKREDFESSEAKNTPILYCKTLLEREDGKGTNVLYGDGRVEYVTAAELDRLKAGAH